MEKAELVQRLTERLGEGGTVSIAQLVGEELWLAVVDGSLEIGQRLPTPRQLAIALGVSPRSIERAYLDLERRGVVATRPGAGTFVSLAQPAEQDRERHRQLTQLCDELVHRAAELGFDIDDVADMLTELRSASADRPQEHSP
ncbi:MAG: GntR family transcriptional regulator [Gemmatimonadota bacterium]